MSACVETADTVGGAWVNTLRAVAGAGGTSVNTVTTVLAPGTEDATVRAVVDEVLTPGRRGHTHVQTVETVANTLFPAALYRSPGYRWSPDLPHEHEQVLDSAADGLFGRYAEMAPLLRTANGNSQGTYFERITDWPVPDGRMVNQLADRIQYLRNARRQRHQSNNVADIAVGFDAEGGTGLQVYAATDRRQQGFPCLVHIDLTVHAGRLHMLALYRNWYLITKGYGNLLGLSRLLLFLSEQTGYPVGELAVAAGTADCERSTYGGRRGVDQIIEKAAPVAVAAR